MAARSITIKGFLAEFKARDALMRDRAFCFILGAGASAQSKIPTGGQLVLTHKRFKEGFSLCETNKCVARSSVTLH
jgi:hypothetical protein